MTTSSFKLRLQTAVALAGLVSSSLLVRAAAPLPSEDEPVLMETLPVTSSHVPTTMDSVRAMLSTLDADALAGTLVKTNVLDALRKSLPALSGGSNLGNTNANTASGSTKGGSRLSLRNLDTLVLVNGRRMVTSAAGAYSGAGNFVDVNLLPLDAIDRIEVLTDGSSALYGSDAVAGVVNIILKSNYQGGKTGGHYGFSSRDGNYNDRSAYAFVGVGNDHVNITAGFHYSASEPLFLNQRPFSFPILGKASAVSGLVGSALLDPTLNSPRDKNPVGPAATALDLNALIANGTYSLVPSVGAVLDVSRYGTELLKQERKAAYTTFNADLAGPRLQFFADFLYSQTKSMAQIFAQGVSYGIAVNSPYNPTRSNLSPVGFRYLGAPRQLFNTSTLTDYTLGLTGQITPRWNWEVSSKGSADRITSLTTNVLYAPNLTRMVAGGFDKDGNPIVGGTYSRVKGDFNEGGSFIFQPAIDPFARDAGQPPGALAHLFGTAHSHFWSRLDTWNAIVRGAIAELPAGPLRLAVGGEYRKDRMQGSPDANGQVTGPTANFWSGNVSFDPFSSARHVTAGFGELRVPVTSKRSHVKGAYALEGSIAFREEQYSDAGHSRVPRYLVQWQPLDEQISLRFSYSKAFTAPALFSSHGANLEGVTDPSTVLTAFPDLKLTTAAAHLRFGSNPDLRPSTAASHSYSLVVRPKVIKGLRFEVDYTEIKQRDFISTIGPLAILQNVDQFGSSSVYANRIGIGNFNGDPGFTAITRPGQISDTLRAAVAAGQGNPASNLFVNDRTTNISGINVRTVDVSATYELPTSQFGTFLLSTAGTFFLDYQYKAVPTEPYFEYAAAATRGGSGSEGTLPGYRFYTTFDWHKNNWGVLLANTYIPSVDDIGPGGYTFATSSALKRIPVDSYSAWDLALTYEVRLHSANRSLKIFQGTKFTAGVSNITDKMPPAAKQAFKEANADISTYSPVGRLYFVSAEFKF